MTYEEMVQKAREIYADADASDVKEHIAIEFDVWGEGEGAFYLEISNGKIYIEPYEYKDRDAKIITRQDTLIKIALGEMDPVAAFLSGQIYVEGNKDKALVLKGLAESRAKKAQAPKAEEVAPAEAPKRKPGRPKKSTTTTAKTTTAKAAPKAASTKAAAPKAAEAKTEAAPAEAPKRKPGRPKKTDEQRAAEAAAKAAKAAEEAAKAAEAPAEAPKAEEAPAAEAPVKRRPGRPRKNPA